MDDKTARLMQLLKGAQARYSDEYFATAIPKIFSKQFITFCAMHSDLELCLNYLNRLKTKPDEIESSAYVYAFISLYGKCFTDASKAKLPKLDAAIFGEEVVLLKTHESLMELRHHFISHRSETESEMGIALLLLPKEGDTEPIIKFNQVKRMGFSDEMISDYEGTIKFLLEKLKIKMQKHGDKALDSILSHFTPEQLSIMVLNNMTDELT